jgi:N-acyl-D-aspartate/D-glutamate deacylase
MDILIQGGIVYDGSGAAPQRADVLIAGERIADRAPCLAPTAGGFPDTIVIDARGKVVCPGFVDGHRHADVAVFADKDFGTTEVAQGITTTVVGNCGMAPIPRSTDPLRRIEQYRYIEPVIGAVPEGLPFDCYRDYADGLQMAALPINMGFLAGAGAIKTTIKGFAKTPFSAAEQAQATGLVTEALEQGALGLSFGIMYQPECYSRFEELCALALPVGKADRILCTHIRGEGDSLVDSVSEMIDVAAEAGVRLNISHFKATGIHNWRSKIFAALARIEAARSKGQPVTADFYPYDGGSTTVLSLIPPGVQEESIAALVTKLSKAAGKEALRREIYRPQSGWDNMALSIGWDRIVISSVAEAEHKSWCGKTMEQIAGENGYDDPVDLLACLVVTEEGRTGIIVLSMAQEDIDEIARLPWTALISDSLYAGGNPHPRLNGAFPKFLREYVRERHVLSMEQAIHKMTSMPAERLGIRERGMVKPGFYADLLVFDREAFTDHADYLHPLRQASGIETVILNGSIIGTNGTLHAGKGRYCRGGAYNEERSSV